MKCQRGAELASLASLLLAVMIHEQFEIYFEVVKLTLREVERREKALYSIIIQYYYTVATVECGRRV